MALILIIIPAAMALIAFLIPSEKLRPWLIPAGCILHSTATFVAIVKPETWNTDTAWFALDPPGTLVLVAISALYLLCSFYATGYLRLRADRPNRIFTSCFLLSLSLITLVIWSRDFGLSWVAIEGTTLMMAPLVYFKRTPQSIEATWKYLLVGSVGITIALLGTFFLAWSADQGGAVATMNIDALTTGASTLSRPWLRAAFVLLLAGYGTKMGLAPMHSWKPDAYGEAPGVVGAIFAGGVTSAAFLILMRAFKICNAAGEGALASSLLVIIGLFSMAIAGAFMINQRDIKRMLAYSSVEHMGILVLGIGIGGPALFGTFLHLMTNSMTKGALFLSSGNIQRAYSSKKTEQVRGALRKVPLSGAIFLAGFLAITGSPPFGPFVSEFSILSGIFETGNIFAGSLFLLFLLVVFIGMGSTVLKVSFGQPPENPKPTEKNSFLTSFPPLAFLGLSLLTGLFLPAEITHLIREAADFIGAAR